MILNRNQNPIISKIIISKLNKLNNINDNEIKIEFDNEKIK